MNKKETYHSGAANQDIPEHKPLSIYIRPTITTYSAEDILASLGPAQTLTGCAFDPTNQMWDCNND